MTQLNPKVFKSYDIRGVYPDDLNEGTALAAGKAYARLTGVKKIVVGRDMRIGSESLAEQFIQGAISQGVDVDDIGLASIDMVYFATGKFSYDGGVMITASHNPKEYNGLKMTVLDNGINMVRGKELYNFMKDKTFEDAEKRGAVQPRDIQKEYLEHIFSFADIKKIKPFKIVVDAGNGMAGKIMPWIFEKLPCTLIPMNFELDGNFPAHPSNPLLPESQAGITKKVVDEGADFGVILDGDTDRLFFITEKGKFILADTTLLVLAKYFLEHNPGAGIAYNAVCSKAVATRVQEWGGRPIRTAVGFVNIADGMRDQDGIMGGEVSAHYCFRDNYYGDSGFIAFLILLMLISEEDKKLSEILDGLNPYFKIDETNIQVEDIDGVIEKVKDKFTDGKQDHLDGLTVWYPDWWLNVRPSNTEPLLRINVEADTPELLEEKSREVLDFIKEAAQ